MHIHLKVKYPNKLKNMANNNKKKFLVKNNEKNAFDASIKIGKKQKN